MFKLLVFCAAAAHLVILVSGFGNYRVEIPNGDRVPHPCKTNYLWAGVGHRAAAGGGNRNPFGQDFAAAGRTWTKELCEKDSDGDGKTNGYELGDPDCTWNKNNLNPDSDHLSHPGVCEPWTDPKCQNQLSWIEDACQSEEFNCSAITDPNLKSMKIQFPPTQVPAQETTYMCMEFDLDTSDDFHMVATQPIINNTNVMHHAVIFACGSNDHTLRSTPHQCGMVASRECRTIISIWTLGSPGECFHDKVGFRIGSLGYKRVSLQFHWNNPSLSTEFIDSSGMVIHYTPTKRANNAGVLTIGAEYINIPGRTPSVVQEAVCPGECTQSFMKEKIYVVSALNHMHYLGRSQKIELFRNGQKVTDITNDNNYNYDSPVLFDFNPPIEVLPGDTLSTTCGYNSLNRENVTYYGDATNNEMCFGFLTYYPNENVNENFCTAFKSIAHCAVQNNVSMGGCDVLSYLRMTENAVRDALLLNSTCSGGCTQQCSDLIQNNPCLKGDVKDYIFQYSWKWGDVGRGLIQLISACNHTNPTTTTLPADSQTSSTPSPMTTTNSEDSPISSKPPSTNENSPMSSKPPSTNENSPMSSKTSSATENYPISSTTIGENNGSTEGDPSGASIYHLSLIVMVLGLLFCFVF